MRVYTVLQNLQDIPEELHDKCRFVMDKEPYNKRRRFSRVRSPRSETSNNPNIRKEQDP
jgi:hypothetical protein